MSSTDEWVRAWRESEETGLKYTESCLDISTENNRTNETTTSLDRHYAQLRPIETKPPIPKESPKNSFRKKHKYGDTLENTELFFADEWPIIIEECDTWQDAIERCFISLQNKKVGDKKGIITQCQTRFSKKRKKEIAWRAQQFSDKMKKGGFRYGLQITLTTDPKLFSSLAEVGEAWKTQLKHFLDFMNKRLRDAGKKKTSAYLKGLEITKSGLLHAHFGLFGTGIVGKIQKQEYNRKTRTHDTVKEWLFPQEDINGLWKKYGMITGNYNIGTFVNRAPVNEVCDYITKHVAKSWGGKSNDMLEAFLHYTGMRQWSASNGAVPGLPESVESWELRGISFSPGEAVLDRMDMIKEGIKLISDDTISWENKQTYSGG